MFVRQTIDLGGDTQKLESSINQFAGLQTSDRLVITVGGAWSHNCQPALIEPLPRHAAEEPEHAHVRLADPRQRATARVARANARNCSGEAVTRNGLRVTRNVSYRSRSRHGGSSRGGGGARDIRATAGAEPPQSERAPPLSSDRSTALRGSAGSSRRTLGSRAANFRGGAWSHNCQPALKDASPANRRGTAKLVEDGRRRRGNPASRLFSV
jgi:hypothetical protein